MNKSDLDLQSNKKGEVNKIFFNLLKGRITEE